MNAFRFYVGSDNSTGKLDQPGLVAALRGFGVQGFTLLTGLGYWEGSSEESAVVEILAPEGFPALGLKTHLERELRQQEVLCAVSPVSLIERQVRIAA